MDQASRPTYIETTDNALTSILDFLGQMEVLKTTSPTDSYLVEPVITPRFVPTCSDTLLGRLGDIAEEKSLRIQSHMSESLDQVEWVRKERGKDDIDVFLEVHLSLSVPRSSKDSFDSIVSLPIIPYKRTVRSWTLRRSAGLQHTGRL